jgi:hypothetical protein
MIVLAFVLFASGGAEPPAMKIEADSGHRVALRIGQELILTLNSNPSTGYRWMRTDTETPALLTRYEAQILQVDTETTQSLKSDNSSHSRRVGWILVAPLLSQIVKGNDIDLMQMILEL